MAITTNVYVQPSQPPDVGVVLITSGNVTGTKGRTVTLEAKPTTPSEYKFSHWEITTSPVSLKPFAEVSDQSFQTQREVCSAQWFLVDSITLYTDGSFLYMDEAGETIAPRGYYHTLEANKYYYWDGVNLPTIQTCGTPSAGGTSGGGGGSTEITQPFI